MNKKLKICMYVLLGIFSFQFSQAQVKGISYTLSPMVSYQNWEKTTGIANGNLIGGQLGFGFGQIVELKANYQEGLDLKRDFSSMDITNTAAGLISDETVKFKRWGGDLKVNVGKGALAPYISVGTGVQTLSLDREDEKETNQIYVNGGAGFQLSLADRYTLNISALNNYYNSNPYAVLLNADERTALGISEEANTANLLENWSFNASLLLYLGGRRPGEMSDMDKAFQENFSSGFNGLSLPIEVSAGQLDFSDDLPYPDSKFTQLSSGFDFGQYVGLRAFYARNMEEGYFSKFGRLALYGGEAKFKLSDGQGLYPTIMLGGGVIDPLSNYELDGQINGQNDVDMENTPFVSGGLGLNLPFSRYVKLSAFAKAMLTTSTETLDQVEATENLSTSWMYGLTANFILGKKSKNVDKVVQSEYDKAVLEALAEERSKTEKVKLEYDARIASLEEEIQKAYEKGDKAEMAKKYQEKEQAIQEKEQVVNLQAKEMIVNREAVTTQNSSAMGISPSEFKTLLEEIKMSNERSQMQLQSSLEMQEIKRTMEQEKLNMQIENLKNSINILRENQAEQQRKLKEESFELKNSIEELKKNESKVGSNEELINEIVENQRKLAELEESDENQEEAEKLKESISELTEELENDSPKNDSPKYRENETLKDIFPVNKNKESTVGTNFHYTGSSVYAGFNVGGDFTLNLGYRRDYQYKNSNFYFVPEAFVGLGNPINWGAFGNGVLKINLKENQSFQPYVGFGLGLMRVGVNVDEANTKLARNIILGANLLNYKNGKFFADLSIRGKFKHYQAAVGYKLSL